MTAIQSPQPPTEAAPNYETVLAITLSWPPSVRATLAHDLINSLIKATEEASPRTTTLSKARGLASNGSPPPNDEEVERILDEHRTEKYG